LNTSIPKHERAFALLIVLILTCLSMILLASSLRWTTESGKQTERQNTYFLSSLAAEAATEKILSAMMNDYEKGGDAQVYNNLSISQVRVPNSSDNYYWANYEFRDGAGHNNTGIATRTGVEAYEILQGQYEGLYGLRSTYTVQAVAIPLTGSERVGAGVVQEVKPTTIPLFQFAIFSSMDLEINPGANMNITGRVHGNANIYTDPGTGVTLNYLNDVTSVGGIFLKEKPGDPNTTRDGMVNFIKAHDGGAPSLWVPIATNNSIAAVRELVNLPPAGVDDPLTAPLRYYNNADIIVLVSNSAVKVTSGKLDSGGPFSVMLTNQVDLLSYSNVTSAVVAGKTVFTTNFSNGWLSTNASFYNGREVKAVRATEIDLAKFLKWNSSNTTIRGGLSGSRSVNSIYIADFRTITTTNEPGIRLINGTNLPPGGLTVATPDPLYVLGSYNITNFTHLGTTNTTSSKPASLVADAITFLSTNWNDAGSFSNVLAQRIAKPMTVNAALLSGIVETTPTNASTLHYSGGVENYPRFLEDWSNVTNTYNGSMVLMFKSLYATNTWEGQAVSYYGAPKRNWAFDLNYLDPNKLPPLTPKARQIIRSSWKSIAAQ
jgi:hypothetical protein